MRSDHDRRLSALEAAAKPCETYTIITGDMTLAEARRAWDETLRIDRLHYRHVPAHPVDTDPARLAELAAAYAATLEVPHAR